VTKIARLCHYVTYIYVDISLGDTLSAFFRKISKISVICPTRQHRLTETS